MLLLRSHGGCLLGRDGKLDSTWLACTGDLNLVSGVINYKRDDFRRIILIK